LAQAEKGVSRLLRIDYPAENKHSSAIATEHFVQTQFHTLLSAVAAGLAAGFTRGLDMAGSRATAKTAKTTGR